MSDRKLQHISDEELLAHYYRSRDNRWLGILLQRYTLLLLGVGMKYLAQEAAAQDCVQQVFIKALSYLPNHTVEHFKSWLYTVMKNECLMLLRRQKNTAVEALPDQVQEDMAEEETYAEREMLLSLMEDTLKELNEEQQKCLRMFYLEKLSYSEIAEKTGFTSSQVKSYIQNGKRNLRLLIEKKMK